MLTVLSIGQARLTMVFEPGLSDGLFTHAGKTLAPDKEDPG